MKKYLRLLVVAICIVIGAAAQGAPDDREAVQARAERLWAAEVASDWGAVYDMLSVAGRGTQTRDEYITNRRTIGPFHYREAKVDDVFLGNGEAWVHISYKFLLVAHPLVPPTSGDYWQIWQKDREWVATGPDERGQWPRLPPSLRPAADEAALAKLSSELWQAKAARDWKAVYQFLDPDYRAEVPVEEFLARKAKYLYSTPRVEWAEVDGGAGRVKVTVAYKFADPAASKMEPSETTLIEKWRKRDGKWVFDVRANNPD